MKKEITGIFIFVIVYCQCFLGFTAENTSLQQEKGIGFRIAILPDTQQYVLGEFPLRAHIFESQTRWIFDHVMEKNIRLVLHLGDIVETNRAMEWELAESFIKKLDGLVPYALALGNHDVASDNARDSHLYNRYFSEKHLKDSPNYGGVFESGKMDNAYQLFQVGNKDYLVLILEPAPRDEVLSWANEIVSAFPHHTVMVVTHCYLADGGGHFGYESSGNLKYTMNFKETQTANDGVEMWNKFIRLHKNIQFVFSGHILITGLGRQVSVGVNGNPVFEIAFNYQMKEEGGGGFLRLLDFSSDGNMVSVKTYSPYLDKYKTDPENEFVLNLNEGHFE